MSIQDIRSKLADIPGSDAMTMRYENGGKIEVFTIEGLEVKVPAGGNVEKAVRDALNGKAK